jgi:hypothetical protein
MLASPARFKRLIQFFSVLAAGVFEVVERNPGISFLIQQPLLFGAAHFLHSASPAFP